MALPGEVLPSIAVNTFVLPMVTDEYAVKIPTVLIPDADAELMFPVTLPVTLPLNAPLKEVAVAIPVPRSIPDALIVAAEPTTTLLDTDAVAPDKLPLKVVAVATPVTTAPRENPTEPVSSLFTISSTCNFDMGLCF